MIDLSVIVSVCGFESGWRWIDKENSGLFTYLLVYINLSSRSIYLSRAAAELHDRDSRESIAVCLASAVANYLVTIRRHEMKGLAPETRF